MVRHAGGIDESLKP